MRIARIKRKLGVCWQILLGNVQPSFAQFGEDRILQYLFSNKELSKLTYLDIGTNEPIRGSNTYFLYQNGASGLCIEPNPTLWMKVRKVRPKDTCLNVGIGVDNQSEADFYVFPPRFSGYNTFSRVDAEQRATEGVHVAKVIKIQLRNVNDIIADFFSTAPDLLSIDVEGFDFEILKSLDFVRFGPKVLIAETLRYGDTAKASKEHEMIDFVLSKGYMIYADTHVNTIFLKVDQE